jgi:hypothetical protein
LNPARATYTAAGRPAMARYTFHYASDSPDDPYLLTCGRLTLAITDRFRGPEPPRLDYGGGDTPPAYDSEDEDEGAGANSGFGLEGLGVALDPAVQPTLDPATARADLACATYWVAAARFQWALRCDRTINARAVLALIADMQADGDLADVRLAFARLSAALAATYPVLGTDRRTLFQLAALGNDMATAVGQSADLFAYVKNELQQVDLAALLRA